MAKRVYVTGAQADAAQLVVERSAAKGKTASAPVQKIAKAASIDSQSRRPTMAPKVTKRASSTLRSLARSASGQFVAIKNPAGGKFPADKTARRAR